METEPGKRVQGYKDGREIEGQKAKYMKGENFEILQIQVLVNTTIESVRPIKSKVACFYVSVTFGKSI